MLEEAVEFDLKDQYISVLLEFYGTKHEVVSEAPMERARIKYWHKIVTLFERLRPEPIRNKAKYRASRAESKHLDPVQVAIVRYAWAAYYAADEDCEAVLRRWETYLYGKPHQSTGNMADYEHFRQKRQFKEMIRGIQAEKLWPWAN
jgi:hypothetical protein